MDSEKRKEERRGEMTIPNHKMEETRRRGERKLPSLVDSREFQQLEGGRTPGKGNVKNKIEGAEEAEAQKVNEERKKKEKVRRENAQLPITRSTVTKESTKVKKHKIENRIEESRNKIVRKIEEGKRKEKEEAKRYIKEFINKIGGDRDVQQHVVGWYGIPHEQGATQRQHDLTEEEIPEEEDTNSKDFLNFFEVIVNYEKASKSKKVNYLRIFKAVQRMKVFERLCNCGIENMAVRIPKRATERWGVIRDWEYSPKELEKAAVPGQSIKTVERMKKRVQVERGYGYIESPLILINFNGVSLPTRLVIYNGITSLGITPYIRNIKQCFNCIRFGHFKKFCRIQTRSCFNCGREAHGECSREKKCVNCGEGHSALSRECMMWQWEHTTNKLTAYKNLSYTEAREAARKELGIQERRSQGYRQNNKDSCRYNDKEFPRIGEKYRHRKEDIEKWEDRECNIRTSYWGKRNEAPKGRNYRRNDRLN
ncbi:uncharacterized protein LOC128884702 isoform X2 [Hylaeus volcanicus]|uniref:uncharacterized protein LOC128884702 isoform X2 n=1 Tax=Hylaeus volcanicus TaxID=313075 RepID=UPI0023B873EF|nr:uncharacterized protein LOC128884702 isoform X2 [Hylaeus volcanicus]